MEFLNRWSLALFNEMLTNNKERDKTKIKEKQKEKYNKKLIT